jgi:hypothetical protein
LKPEDLPGGLIRDPLAGDAAAAGNSPALNMTHIDESKKRASASLLAESPGNNQLLYFTSPSLTADDSRLIFLSDRTGDPNLFVRDLASGQEWQLSDNTDGLLKSYIYFEGRPYLGLGKASASLDVHKGIVYYIQGRQICAATLDGRRRVLAEYPADQMTAYTHLSADGTRLCVPTTDARALDGDRLFQGRPDYDIDERVRNENLSSYIRIYDTATGEEVVCERLTGGWITHVQFSPIDNNLILYNNEWCSLDQGIRRMWIWDGHTHRRLRQEGHGRERMDYVVHEMWQRDGRSVIYHGAYIKRSPEYNNLEQFVGSVKPDGSDMVEIAVPRSWGHYGHYTVGNAGELVTDGYYEEPGDPVLKKTADLWIDGGAWITLMKVDWLAGHITWIPLCRHGSSWTTQDCHPHPVFNHRANSILFTSDKDNRRSVYRVNIPI